MQEETKAAPEGDAVMATDGGDAAEGHNETSHVSQRTKIAMC